jgi:hypothetical protein
LQQRDEDVEMLLHPAHRVIPWEAQSLLDDHRMAGRHADRQSAPQRSLRRQRLAGEDEGLAPEQLGDGGSDLDAWCALTQGRQCRERVHPPTSLSQARAKPSAAARSILVSTSGSGAEPSIDSPMSMPTSRSRMITPGNGRLPCAR